MSCFERGANLGYNGAMRKLQNFFKKMMSLPKNILVTLALVAVFFASSWSLFSPQFFRVHDYTHAARISQMTRALQDGHFPVRWTEDFGYGYGMPLFEFYAPFPYYVGSMFYWLGFNIVLVIKILFALSSLGTLLGAYKLGQKMYGSLGGILVSAAISLAPYRALNLFVRGALSEAWAIMALPWILYALMKVIDSIIEKKLFNQSFRSWSVLVFSLVVLFLSHNLTTLMFLPTSLVFATVYWLYAYSKKYSFVKFEKSVFMRSLIAAAFRTASAYVLAIGLSAFYLVPAFVEKGFTKVEQYVLGGYFNYHLHFLYIRQFFNSTWGFGGSAWGVDDDISFFLGYWQLLSLLIISLFVIKQCLQVIPQFLKSKQKFALFHDFFLRKEIFWTAGFSTFLVGSLFMTLLKSESIWNLFTLLSFIQFPWRWLSVAIIFMGLVVGIPVLFIQNKVGRFLYVWLGLAVLILSNFYYFRPEKFLEQSDDYYYTDRRRIRENMSSILEDYVPIQMAQELPPQNTVVYDSEDQGENTDTFSTGEHIRKIEYEVLLDRTQEKLIATDAENDILLPLNLADFPGWFVELDGEKIPHSQGAVGNIQVSVPSGEHQVSVKLGYTPVRFYSDLLSLVSLFVFVWFMIGSDKKSHFMK